MSITLTPIAGGSTAGISLAGAGGLDGSFLALLQRQVDTLTASLLDALPGAAGAGSFVAGRNPLLADPESAYRMMTEINRREVAYQAEYAEMREMGSEVAALRGAADRLATLDETSSDTAIAAGIDDFVAAYNAWIDRFDEALAADGLLAGTQAATVAQWELEKSIESIFHGAAGGVRGMTALGIVIDPVSNRASLDRQQLAGVLAGNRSGAVGAIDDFAANFARSAELLNSDGNFIANRLANLSRVIDYIDRNKAALQMEFGLGDAARPNTEVARALAAYRAMGGAAG